MPGLPQAQIKRKAELQAQMPPVETTQPERVLIPIDVPNPQPANEDPPNAEPEHEEPLSLEKQWEIKSKSWEEKYRSLQGVVEGLEPQLRSEREQRQKLEQQIQELREAMPRPEVRPDPNEELTEEEVKIYGESAPIVEKIARKIARGELKGAIKDLEKQITELKEAGTRIETGVHANEEERFVSRVKDKVKNFDKIIELNEWQDYLRSKVPYTKTTIGQALQTAHDARDFDSVVEIFEGFKPSKAVLDSMRSPTLNGGSGPVDLNGHRKPMLKWSDRERISEDFRKGRIPREVRDQWDKVFKEAEAENRIDYSK